MKYIVSLGAGEEQAFAINTAMSKGLKVIAFDMKECDYSLVKPDLFYNISIHEKEKVCEGDFKYEHLSFVCAGGGISGDCFCRAEDSGKGLVHGAYALWDGCQ